MTLLCLGDPVNCEDEFKDLLHIKYVRVCEESELECLGLRDNLYKQQWEVLKSIYEEVGSEERKLNFIKDYLDDYFGD